MAQPFLLSKFAPPLPCPTCKQQGLHEHNARNKTFDVCNENFGKEGLQQYELIAHLPDKSSNYIKSALSDLQSMS